MCGALAQVWCRTVGKSDDRVVTADKYRARPHMVHVHTVHLPH